MHVSRSSLLSLPFPFTLEVILACPCIQLACMFPATRHRGVELQLKLASQAPAAGLGDTNRALAAQGEIAAAICQCEQSELIERGAPGRVVPYKIELSIVGAEKMYLAQAKERGIRTREGEREKEGKKRKKH